MIQTLVPNKKRRDVNAIVASGGELGRVFRKRKTLVEQRSMSDAELLARDQFLSGCGFTSLRKAARIIEKSSKNK